MKHLHRSLPVLVALLAPVAAGCGSADIQTTPVTASAGVDVNATAGATAGSSDSYDDQDPSSLTDFHPTLDSHGQWVDDPTYGTVWVPNQAEVGPDFTPYSTAGHWAVDDSNQYVWVSDYDWGWAPFHYGRWVSTDTGWAWVPGREYAPAWVSWGADDGYGHVGWYPMGPTYVWRGGVAVNYTYNVGPRWNYVGRGDLFASNVGTHVVRGSAAASFSAGVHESGGGGGHGHSSGPAPSQLGFSGGQVPHVSAGASAGGVAKAQQFGHPSTATSMGGHAPTHTGPSTSLAGSHPTGGATGAAGLQREPTTGLAGAGGTSPSTGLGRAPTTGLAGTSPGASGSAGLQRTPTTGLTPSAGSGGATVGGGRTPETMGNHGLTPSASGVTPGGATPKKKVDNDPPPHATPKGGTKGGGKPTNGHH
jgi:hypothetical protein